MQPSKFCYYIIYNLRTSINKFIIYLNKCIYFRYIPFIEEVLIRLLDDKRQCSSHRDKLIIAPASPMFKHINC
ncbi:MAG: hypothetical protein AUJ49_03535 [Desulfovibrionaceae bacterium CG1_02_65_16]|nr:MAG: hypothetical protein AUJ49_03535 [Desulfovibrionaceae bacterium CG1_02_65_16]